MFANWLPLYSLLSYHWRKIMAAILEQAAAITRVFNIMDEDMPEAVAGESDEPALTRELQM